MHSGFKAPRKADEVMHLFQTTTIEAPDVKRKVVELDTFDKYLHALNLSEVYLAKSKTETGDFKNYLAVGTNVALTENSLETLCKQQSMVLGMEIMEGMVDEEEQRFILESARLTGAFNVNLEAVEKSEPNSSKSEEQKMDIDVIEPVVEPKQDTKMVV